MVTASVRIAVYRPESPDSLELAMTLLRRRPTPPCTPPSEPARTLGGSPGGRFRSVVSGIGPSARSLPGARCAVAAGVRRATRLRPGGRRRVPAPCRVESSRPPKSDRFQRQRCPRRSQPNLGADPSGMRCELTSNSPSNSGSGKPCPQGPASRSSSGDLQENSRWCQFAIARQAAMQIVVAQPLAESRHRMPG